MTLLEAITKVGGFINQALTDDTKTITKTEVTSNLNIAYREVVNAVIDADQEYQLRETNADLVANQSSYELPADCKKLLRVEIAPESTTSYMRCQKTTIQAIDDPSMTISTATPLYALISNGYKLFPTPSNNVESGIKLFYYENITSLSDDSAEFNIPLGYEHIPTYYAGAMAKYRLGLDSEANNLMGLYRAEIDRMKIELSPRVQSGEDYVIIREEYTWLE